MTSIQTLFLAGAVFFALHAFVSGTGLRGALVRILGETLYFAAFSLASVAAIVWLAVAYNAASVDPANRQLFGPWTGVQHLGLPVMLVAFVFAAVGLLTPNPTAIGGGRVLDAAPQATGILRVTRHPFLWGAALWAAFHLVANGDLASTIFFGTFLLLTLRGTVSIDAKRAAAGHPQWPAFKAQTSNLPFAAILLGRNRLAPGELFDWRVLVALALFAVMLAWHHVLFRVSPFPGGWVPF